MAESAALVPVPFYAPVRTGTSPFFTFGETSRYPVFIERQARTVAPESDDGLTYSGGGRFVADARIGTRVNIYV
ncbi:hypothetical protein [uncultured Desulfosarcina sp.]|uniref:hypothetical protein n=1 Tax=uncultured Desulfosarcina sp. TaxID=218289 RepID=UPI0029C6B7E8|nr:hypothetical protein [uncultured Desulfosarcina sp.]